MYCLDQPARHADHRHVTRHALEHHGIGTDTHPVLDEDRSEHLGTGTDHDVVAQGRVALALVPAGATQGDAMVERAVIADLGGFPDHHPHAVIDEKAPPDAGTGMDFDARIPARNI